MAINLGGKLKKKTPSRQTCMYNHNNNVPPAERTRILKQGVRVAGDGRVSGNTSRPALPISSRAHADHSVVKRLTRKYYAKPYIVAKREFNNRCNNVGW